ncbi:MAG TPA: S8 family serine peptidase, partial [Acidimicrobiales bacterium]
MKRIAGGVCLLLLALAAVPADLAHGSDLAAAAAPTAAAAGDTTPASVADTAAAAPTAPGVLVVDSGDAGPDGVAEALADVPRARVDDLGVDDYVRVTVPRDHVAEAARVLRADGDIGSVEPDPIASAVAFRPTDPQYASQWSAGRIGLPSAWDVTLGAPSIVVAVLDTGVDTSHPELRGATVPGLNLVSSGPPVDRHGHGTEVAGVIAARLGNGVGGVGVCPRCSVMPVKVLDDDGHGPLSVIAAGIVAAADRGAHVINLSLGSFQSSSLLEAAVAHARARWAVVVAAAGNYGQVGGGQRPLYPAAYPGVISVAASDADDRIYPWSSTGSWVAVAAPGCTVTATVLAAAGLVCGTSVAAPVVSGVLGLAMTAERGAGRARYETAVLSTTAPVTPAKRIRHGRVDAAAALRTIATLLGKQPAALRWGGWQTLSPAPSAPAVVSWGEGRSDLFAIDGDGRLVQRWFVSGSGWGPAGGWHGLGAPPGVRLVGQPAVASQEPWSLDVFARGSDDALWQRSYRPGKGWSAWLSRGGVLTSSPGAVSWGRGHVAVVVVGSDRAVWLKSWTATGSWTRWVSLGGTATSAPGVASWEPGRLDVFVRGVNESLYHRTVVDGRPVSAWLSQGGVLTGDGRPDAVSWGRGRFDVFVVGAGGSSVYRRAYHRGYGWLPTSGYERLGAPVGSLLSGTAVRSWRPGQLEVFVT